MPFKEVLLAQCGEWVRRGKTQKVGQGRTESKVSYNSSYCLSRSGMKQDEQNETKTPPTLKAKLQRQEAQQVEKTCSCHQADLSSDPSFTSYELCGLGQDTSHHLPGLSCSSSAKHMRLDTCTTQELWLLTPILTLTSQLSLSRSPPPSEPQFLLYKTVSQIPLSWSYCKHGIRQQIKYVCFIAQGWALK